MITLATAGLLSRFWKPLAGAILLVAALAGLVYGVLALGKAVYGAGFREAQLIGNAALAKAAKEAEISRLGYEHRIDLAAQALKNQEEESALKLLEAQARVKVVTKRVEVAIHDNPAFVALERPADFRRLRDEAFAELADAAQRGADVPGPGLASVRSADPGPGRDARLGGTGGRAEPPPLVDVRPRP